ncbi:MAG TPA: dihydroneopterin aldolase [Yaniella sp.]
MATITLTGLRARGHHGVLDHERATGQVFLVDLELDVDIAKAAETDDVADAVNYADVAAVAEQVIVGEPVNLIETLVTRIADAVLAKFDRVRSVVVTVHKPQAPIPADFENVAITVTRNKTS